MTLKKLGRLFTIKTRLEAFLITYAIAVGSIERGAHYMQSYPGYGGILLAIACLGVPFIAGAKLIDSVSPATADAPNDGKPSARPAPRHRVNHSRPRHRRSDLGSALPSSHRID